jgi:hypothetical protein
MEPDEFDDLLAATATSIDSWDNSYDDDDWDETPPRKSQLPSQTN